MSTGYKKFSKDEGPLLIPTLAKNGVISEPVFGWFITDEEEQSYLDIGVLTADSIREGEELVWIDVLYDDYWWTNFVNGIKINGKGFKTPKDFALTDTGTSCIYVPSSIHRAIEDMIL